MTQESLGRCAMDTLHNRMETTMTTLIYQDEKSHKFWTIEQKETELHLNWGRVGTQGQSQIKTFDDRDQATQARDKLIKEKTKKGYRSEGSGDQPASPAAKKVATAKKVAAPAAARAATAATSSPAADAAPDAPPPVEASAGAAPGATAAATLSATTASPSPASHSGNAPFWLADDDAIPLPVKYTVQVLSRRNGAPPVRVPTSQPSDNLRLMKQTVSSIISNGAITMDSNRCQPEWQQAIALAQRCIDQGLALPKESPAAGAALLLLRHCFSGRLKDEVMDAIVFSYGLEYAVELLIAHQQIDLDFVYNKRHAAFFHADQPPEAYRQNFYDFERRLRLHLSLADEALWQTCAERLSTALPEIPLWHQSLFAFLLPEKPELADIICANAAGNKKLASIEWLKLTATREETVQALEKFQEFNLFDDYYLGESLSATLVAEQGIAGLARLRPYAAGDRCGELLTHINHPQALALLIDASAKTKRSHERMVRASKAFPHATLAALAALLSDKEDALWRSQLRSLLYNQPELAAEVIPWLAGPAARLVEEIVSQLNTKVDYADASMLPPILVAPPWLNKKKKATVPVLSLAVLPLDPVMEAIDPGVMPSWQQQRIERAKVAGSEKFLTLLGFDTWKKKIDQAIAAWEQNDLPGLMAAWEKNHAHFSCNWNVDILAALPQPKALEMWNRLSQTPHSGVAHIVSYLGLAALPGLLNSLGRQPQEGFPVALHMGATELAPLAARAYARLKTQRDIAQRWLLKYPEHALAGILPDALGKSGEAQDSARITLRMLVDKGHQAQLMALAARYQLPEVMSAVEALLALDPLDSYPAKRPALPAFYEPVLWPRPRLNNGMPLGDEALTHLGTMLRFPTEDGLYPGLQQVKEACLPDSLADFAWQLFASWLTEGAPAKESWAFSTLGVFGNDDTARQLTPLIRVWPGESQHKRAVLGLDVLAGIGTDIALMQLNGIAQKLKFKGLQEKAREKISQIAEQRNLSVAELEDRLAPDLGLDENGSLLLDFGPRQFNVSFDEALKPYVRDTGGSRLKDLPKPNKSDDPLLAPEAVNRYKALKKDARTIASQQIRRLEVAMCLRRRWTPVQFRQFLVEHPLVGHLTRRLVWAAFDKDNQLTHCFRVAEDNSYSTADDDLFTLPETTAAIGIPHILEITPADAAAFGQLLADYELTSPFRQLDRNSYLLTPAEADTTNLQRWPGRACPSGRLMGLINRGWLRGQPLDAGWIGWMLKPLGQWTLVLEMTEGFGVDLQPDEIALEQQLGDVWLWRGVAQEFGWGQQTPQKEPFSVLDKVAISEVLSDIETLFD